MKNSMQVNKFIAVGGIVLLSTTAYAKNQCAATVSEDRNIVNLPCIVEGDSLYSGFLELQGNNRYFLKRNEELASPPNADLFCSANLDKKTEGANLYVPCIDVTGENYSDGTWKQVNQGLEFELTWMSNSNASNVLDLNESAHNRAAVSGSKFDQWVQRANGVCKDMDGSHGCQCVDLMHDYIQEVLGVSRASHNIRGNAYDIYAGIPLTGKTISYGGVTVKLTKIPNTPTGVPQKGDIVFWNKSSSNGYAGHVAMFVNGNASTFTSIDQNWINASTRGSKAALVSHNYTSGGGVVGWLRPDVIGGSAVLTTPPTVVNASPSNGTSFLSSTAQIPLAWRASSDATNYRVIVSTKEDFSGFNDDLGNSTCDSSCFTWTTTSTSGVFTQPRPGQTYYWTVRANNSNANLVSSFTESWSFNVASSNTSPTVAAEQAMNRCYSSFSQYFGSKTGGLIDSDSFIAQLTTGVVAAIAVKKDLSDGVFYYYWNGWKTLGLNYCN